MSLLSKKILIIGGNGYTGNYIASRLVQQQASVSSLSRRGARYNYPENNKVEWIQGDILQSAKHQEKINSADIIVHTVGTFFDSSLLRRTEPGGAGTYEQINRETLVSLLKILKTPKKVIFMSSSPLPFSLQRYHDTKEQAEKQLQSSLHEGYSLRPGIIYSWKRAWSMLLKWDIDFYNRIYGSISNNATTNSKYEQFLKTAKPSYSISLQEMGDAVLQICLNGHQKKLIQNAELQQLSQKYRGQRSV